MNLNIVILVNPDQTQPPFPIGLDQACSHLPDFSLGFIFWACSVESDGETSILLSGSNVAMSSPDLNPYWTWVLYSSRSNWRHSCLKLLFVGLLRSSREMVFLIKRPLCVQALDADTYAEKLSSVRLARYWAASWETSAGKQPNLWTAI